MHLEFKKLNSFGPSGSSSCCYLSLLGSLISFYIGVAVLGGSNSRLKWPKTR